MSYRRRSAPVSTLRARLQQRLAEKNSWEGREAFSAEDAEQEPKPFFAGSILKAMHRYLPVKITAAVVIVFVAAFLTWGDFDWGAPLLQALRFVVEWEIKADAFSGKVAPAFQLIRDHAALPSKKNSGPPLPFAGSLKSGFGLREDPDADQDRMHYGIDLGAPEGVAVRALHAGEVEQVAAVAGSSDPDTVVIGAGSGWIMIYRGLVDVGVKEGDKVEPGTLLGKLGPPRLYDQPHLHFELRCDGHPVPPPEDWLARFTGDVTSQ